MPPSLRSRPTAAVVGWLSFLLIGWSGLLVPSLIRSVKDTFEQTDAGIGLFYFVFAVAYAIGALGGGLATERLGRRAVLTSAAVSLAAGLAGLGLAPGWWVFLVAAVPLGLGAGGVDGGGNGLIVDLFTTGRGRALNLLHLFFSLGALSAPFAIGQLVQAGVAWQGIVLGTAFAALPVAGLFATVTMPAGRRVRGPADAAAGMPADPTAVIRVRDRIAVPLVLLALAIACYVASEVGVSNWLVRFLEPAPLDVATIALSLYWAGLTLGRLVAARLGDRFDHTWFATVAASAMALALVAAVFAPSLQASIVLFGVSGFASGPVYPMIIAIAGHRYPDRAAAVTGLLAGSAVAGSVVYPPIMGFLSVTVGLTVAMLGTAALGLACAGLLLPLRARVAMARA